jgi:hypothetical protein
MFYWPAYLVCFSVLGAEIWNIQDEEIRRDFAMKLHWL